MNRPMTSWGKEAAKNGNEEEGAKPWRKRSRRSGTVSLEYLKTKRGGRSGNEERLSVENS